MNRTPRNFGQSFSAAAVIGFSVVTEVVIIVVIVVVGVGDIIIMCKGLLLEFATGHSIMHISIVMLNDIASVMAF